MAVLTLKDIAERTGSDAVIGLIEEVVTVAPELSIIPMRVKPGTTYRVTKRTGLPTVGFRAANEGVTPSKSTYKSEAKPMYFFDAQLQVDEAIVKGEDGSSLGSVLADESTGVMQAMGIAMGNQVYQGKAADDQGFLGLKDQITTGSTYTVDATGSGGSTSTAWLVWLDPGYKGVSFVVGNNGDMQLGAWAKQQVTDPLSAAKKFMAWVSNMSFYIGLQVHSDQSVWRIKNLTTAQPLTDALGEKLKSQVPMARRANLCWFMNRTALYQLQLSRYVVGQYAGQNFPPEPTFLAGVRIVVTDSIADGAAS